jgi:hypothetical protein
VASTVLLEAVEDEAPALEAPLPLLTASQHERSSSLRRRVPTEMRRASHQGAHRQKHRQAGSTGEKVEATGTIGSGGGSDERERIRSR